MREISLHLLVVINLDFLLEACNRVADVELKRLFRLKRYIPSFCEA